MYLMIEIGIRGGISQCIKVYSKENNKYVKQKYLKHINDKYLMYIGSNNLYQNIYHLEILIGLILNQNLLMNGEIWF